ncbi:MAG: gamma-glutamylcyclotransferase [Rhodobacteraceae bacterium]|nr:gamma-glutamylcyclotransferase [Paracoccaceae bacterium]
MSDPFFFGYGSLVNRATHDYTNAHPARLRGWRRVWRHTDLRPVAFLTAVPDSETEIEGLVAGVPGHDWAALDAREHAYDRHHVSHATNHPLPHEVEVQVYSIPDGKHGRPDSAHPILLSYVDVVIQGYLREFGEVGVRRFVETTDGWDAPVLDDRADPRYPRHKRLTTGERELVDGHLSDLGVTILASA